MEIKPIAANALPLVDLQARRPDQEARRGGDAAAAAKKVAGEFEAMFVTMMLKSMRETVGKDTLTGGGRGEETFRSLLDQEYATAAVKSGGIGLARTIERELLRAGHAAPAPLKGENDAD